MTSVALPHLARPLTLEREVRLLVAVVLLVAAALLFLRRDRS